MISTDPDTEFWINVATSRNSRITVMLDQENNPDLYGVLLTDDEQLKHFRKSIERNVRRVKELDSPSVQVAQYSK